MDLEAWENSTFNSTESSPILYAIEIPVAFSALGSIIANILAIYTISRFPILKAHHPYIYILNWRVCDTFFLIFSPTNFRMFGLIESPSAELLCIIWDGIFVFLISDLIFVSILILDWYITTYSSQNCSFYCRKLSRFISLVTFILGLVFLIVTITSCLYKVHFPLIVIMIIFGNLGVFILVVVVHILRLIKFYTSSVIVIKSNLVLILVSSFLICWFPNWLCLYFYVFSYTTFSEWIELVISGIGYANGMVVFGILYYLDGNFQRCFRHLCKFREENIEMVCTHSELSHTTTLI